MRRFFLVSLALIAFAFPAFAQAKHPFTFEDMMKLKRVGDPQVSPDGKWVIFSVVDVDLAANTKTPHIWIVPLAEEKAGSSTPQDASPSANHPAPVGMTGGGEREIIADQDADRPRWAPDEMCIRDRRVIGPGVGGKPILVVDLLAPRRELGIEMFGLITLLLGVSNLRNSLAVGLYDLEIVIVHPDATLEIPLFAYDRFRRNVEDKAVQRVFLLLAYIKDVVFRNLFRGQHEGQLVAEILYVAFIKSQPAVLKRGLRRKDNVLHVLAFVVIKDVENLVIFTCHRFPVAGLYFDVLPVSVVLARFLE